MKYLARFTALAALLLLVLTSIGHTATLNQSPVSNNRSGGSATSATLNVVFASTVGVGDGVAIGFTWVVTAGTGSITTVTDDKSNIYTVDRNVNDPFSGLNICLAHAVGVNNAPQTISITIGSTLAANIIIDADIYDVAGVNTFDTSVSGTNSASVTLNATITAATTSEFGWASVATSSPTTYTQNTGWTTDFTGASNGDYFMHNLMSASGTNTLNATAALSVHHAWVIGALKQVGGGTAPSNMPGFGIGAALRAPPTPYREIEPVDHRWYRKAA